MNRTKKHNWAIIHFKRGTHTHILERGEQEKKGRDAEMQEWSLNLPATGSPQETEFCAT